MAGLIQKKEKKKRQKKKHNGNLNGDLRLYKLAQKKTGKTSLGGTFLVC